MCRTRNENQRTTTRKHQPLQLKQIPRRRYLKPSKRKQKIPQALPNPRGEQRQIQRAHQRT